MRKDQTIKKQNPIYNVDEGSGLATWKKKRRNTENTGYCFNGHYKNIVVEEDSK